jgi:hypothetical protein
LTQRLLLTAAADPIGEVSLLWRAAERLGIGADAAAPAQDAGLIEFGARVRFHHPLLRAAVYRAAAIPDRREVHRVLADAGSGAAWSPRAGRRAGEFAAGAPEAAYELLAMAEFGRLDELQRAQLMRLRAQMAFAERRGSDAPRLLLDAAQALAPLDRELAR